jgi:hypothetical protein
MKKIYYQKYNQRLESYYILHVEPDNFGIPKSALAIVRQHSRPLFHPDLTELPQIGAAWNFDTKVLHVANTFDMLTAMREHDIPMSYLSAIRYLQKYPKFYDPVVVLGLCKCLKILPVGSCVDLSDGQKGLVLSENPNDFGTPVVLLFSNLKVVDLSEEHNGKKLRIKDNMRTMDNRIAMDEQTLQQFEADEALTNSTSKLLQKLHDANERYNAEHPDYMYQRI